MTEYQEFMLSICFGAVMGVFIAELGILIASAISGIKNWLRKRKAKKENTNPD